MNIDYLSELEPYMDQFANYRIRGNKLQSCSPFRYEKRPSFAVNLDNGTWIDSGAPSLDHYKGNFTSLLCYLRHEDYEDTQRYLDTMYGNYRESHKPVLTFSLADPKLTTFNWKDMSHLHYRSPYLARRGVSDEVQKLFCIGYDRNSKAIAMPWFNLDKQIVNIKYRSTYCKKFWYEPGGQRVTNYLYGLAQVKYKKIEDIALVESEIDAMYLWSNGIPAIAAGHAGLSDNQLNELSKVGIRSITLAMDNDEAGNRFKEQCKDKLWTYDLYEIQHLIGAKDVNDIYPEELKEIFRNKTKVGLRFKLKDDTMSKGTMSKEERIREAKERKRRALERKKKETEDKQS